MKKHTATSALLLLTVGLAWAQPDPADPAPARASTAPPARIWNRIASEGASFTVPPGSIVRYGAGGSMVEREVSGDGECSNGFFGQDPARERRKVCEVLGGDPAAYKAQAAARAAAPVVTAPTSPVTYHFSDCQAGAAPGCVRGSNTNPGTLAAPKQDLSGIPVNALAGGSQLLFQRGGAWNWSTTLRLDNRNASAASPLTFGAYGTGPAPLLQVSSRFFVETGEWANTQPDGGYVFRGLKLSATATAPPDAKAIWLRGTVSDVLIEDVEFTNFFIALYGQGGQDVQRVTVRNSRFIRNKSMGVLGSFNNSLFENNLFEANNVTGSGFEHGTYLSNFSKLTLRNNRYIRNSVVNGVCQGGNMTFHGQIDGLLIEGNRIEQDASAPGCWLMSITQGYASAEWFRNVVVRNNKFINGGNTAMAAQSSPGILVEGNVFINTYPTKQVAVSVGHTDYPNGDAPDGDATVRNNSICQSGGASGPPVVFHKNPGATQSNNVVITGTAATTGVCAR
jgi:Right handed beta helix region